RETAYYPVAQLEAVKRELGKREAGEVGLAEACRITARSEDTLRDTAWCIANGINQRRQKLHGAGPKGARVSYSFVKADLVAYASRPKAEIPADRLTATQAAARLRVSQGTVRKWCRAGILADSWERVQAGWTRKRGWLVKKASVEEVWEVIRKQPNPIAAGWALHAQGRRPVAANGPASLPAPAASSTTGAKDVAAGQARSRLGDLG